MCVYLRLKLKIMKKMIAVVSFVCIAAVGFSQTSTNQQTNTEKTKVLKKRVTQKGQLLLPNTQKGLIKPVEKIQTTVDGVVVTDVPYKPEYPTPMYEQKVKATNNPKK